MPPRDVRNLANYRLCAVSRRARYPAASVREDLAGRRSLTCLWMAAQFAETMQPPPVLIGCGAARCGSGSGMGDANAAHYRPDIDGLRALAVLGVVAYHAAPTWVRGGYIGVDVFFVISGFLISGIILRERDAGEFSLLNFYARRVRRLFPALVVVLATTGLIGWYYLLPDEFVALGKHMLAGAGYAINFILRQESGYFDAAAEAKPLLHLWSLGVEEQFYIVWPLLLIFIRDRRTLMLVVALVIAASFAGSLYSLSKNPPAAFYLPHYRMWQLGAGALLAAVALYQPSRLRVPPQLANALSVSGFVLLVVAMLLLATRKDYPGFYGLIPVAGVMLLIAAGPLALVNRFLLANPAAVFVGLISYPLYLWHWPLLSFAHILGIKSDPWVVPAILAASTALATLTYYGVERPLRHLRMRALPVGLVTVTTAVGVIGATAYLAWLPPRLNALAFQDLSSARSDWEFPQGLKRDRLITSMKLFRAGTGPNSVLFLGDSNVEQYWPRVRQLRALQLSDRPVVFATLGGCPPVLGMHPDDRPDCERFMADIPRVANDPGITTVVISADWLVYFEEPACKVAGVESMACNAGFERLEQLMRGFASSGKAVWLILGIPRGGTLGPESIIQRSLSGKIQLRPMYADRQSSWETIRIRLKRRAQAAGARIIDPFPYLCDQRRCHGRTAAGQMIYRDSDHLRSSFVREHATFIDEALQDVSTGSIDSGASRSTP